MKNKEIKKTEKIRVNYLMPVHLHNFVKEQANELGIPASTMYIMIVNMYKDNLRIVDNLSLMNSEKKDLKAKVDK